jgi:hypothetical protein
MTDETQPNEAPPITFEYDGETYEVVSTRKWPIRVLELAKEQDYIGCLQLILGNEQWAKFRAGHESIGELADFFTALQKVAGN